MISVQVKHYLGRARDFLEGMKFLKDDLGTFKYSSALLGIHGAISYGDALRIGLGGESLSSDDHRNATRELRALLALRRIENVQGLTRLERLLSEKNLIAYSANTATEKDIKSIVEQTERFSVWAEITGKALKIEGWSDD